MKSSRKNDSRSNSISNSKRLPIKEQIERQERGQENTYLPLSAKDRQYSVYATDPELHKRASTLKLNICIFQSFFID